MNSLVACGSGTVGLCHSAVPATPLQTQALNAIRRASLHQGRSGTSHCTKVSQQGYLPLVAGRCTRNLRSRCGSSQPSQGSRPYSILKSGVRNAAAHTDTDIVSNRQPGHGKRTASRTDQQATTNGEQVDDASVLGLSGGDDQGENVTAVRPGLGEGTGEDEGEVAREALRAEKTTELLPRTPGGWSDQFTKLLRAEPHRGPQGLLPSRADMGTAAESARSRMRESYQAARLQGRAAAEQVRDRALRRQSRDRRKRQLQEAEQIQEHAVPELPALPQAAPAGILEGAAPAQEGDALAKGAAAEGEAAADSTDAEAIPPRPPSEGEEAGGPIKAIEQFVAHTPQRVEEFVTAVGRAVPVPRVPDTHQGNFVLGLGVLLLVSVTIERWWWDFRLDSKGLKHLNLPETHREPEPQPPRVPAAVPPVPTSEDMRKKESVEWINMVLGKMFRVYRTGLQLWLVGILQPLIDDLNKPKYVQRVRIKSFFLGEEPITVRSIERRTSRRANDLQ
eukprot:jgi/Mesen1/1108/ME000123S00277